MKKARKLFGLAAACLIIAAAMTVFAFAASDIGYITVEKLDIPMIGLKPDTSVIAAYRDNASKVNTSIDITNVKWEGTLDKDGCFVKGNSYKVVITATLKSSVTVKYSDNLKSFVGKSTDRVRINGNAAVLESCADRVAVISYTYKETAKKAINTVNAGNFTEPKAGLKPDTTIDNIPLSAGATPSSSITDVKWIGTFDEDGCFIKGNTYTLEITAKINDTENVRFDKETLAAYKGKTSKFTMLNNEHITLKSCSDTTMVMTKTYSHLDKTEIDLLEITVTAPRHGEYAKNSAKTEWDYVFKSVDVSWPGAPSYGEPFKNGIEYSVAFVYVIEKGSGYTFSKDVCATVNGGEAKAIYGENSLAQYIQVSYTFPKLNTVIVEDGDIKKVTVGGFGAPHIDRKLEAPEVEFNNYYELSDYSWSETPDASGYFKADTVYTLTVTLVTKYSHRFSAENLDTVGKTNQYASLGSTRPTIISFDEKKLVMQTTFAKTAGYKGEKPATLIDSPFAFDGGSGTYEDPYLVSTAEQLNAIRKGLDKHYRLTHDIDLSSWGNWIPIGSNEAYGGPRSGSVNQAYKNMQIFTGSIDGDGHVIKGMTIKIEGDVVYMEEQLNVRYYGLIMHIDCEELAPEYAVGSRYKSPYTSEIHRGVRNLGMVDYVIDIHHKNIAKAYEVYIGPIVASSHGAGIYNCYSGGGTIRLDLSGATTDKVDASIGGIAGQTSYTDFRNCYNTSNITVIGTPHMELHELYGTGICGENISSWFMSCYNTGDIVMPKYDYEVIKNGVQPYSAAACGITGMSWAPIYPELYHNGEEKNCYVWNCYNTGSMTGEYAMGIMINGNSDYYIDSCYNVGKLSGGAKGKEYEIAKTADINMEMSHVLDFGTEYVRRVYKEGNSVTGDVWHYSSNLGRKILKAIPEDNPPSRAYIFAKPKTNTRFTDVVANSYYEQAVIWALEAGVTSGTSETTFSPDATCTRGQVVTFLWRALGKPEPKSTENPFKDVKSTDYFYKAVLWAVENKITVGTSADTFSPHATCTSCQVITFVHRAKGTPRAENTDYKLASSYRGQYYFEAVAWADTIGLLDGLGKAFAPNDDSPRADIVTYLYRMASK